MWYLQGFALGIADISAGIQCWSRSVHVRHHGRSGSSIYNINRFARFDSLYFSNQTRLLIPRIRVSIFLVFRLSLLQSSFCRLFIGLWCLLLGGMMQIFLQNTTMELVISIGGALLFCLFIVFDTQLIMHTLSPEEYILATINIYLDIINLFLHILRALAASKQ